MILPCQSYRFDLTQAYGLFDVVIFPIRFSLRALLIHALNDCRVDKKIRGCRGIIMPAPTCPVVCSDLTRSHAAPTGGHTASTFFSPC